jgi:serine/threonine protein phosphatase 1
MNPKPSPLLPDARVPDGVRFYAIGDVHGRLDLLRDMHARIEADLRARPVAHRRIIHLGDYIDRGPDSAGVVAHLIEMAQTGDVACLAGNHDLYLLTFLSKPAEVGEQWLRYGGVEALASWGIDVDAPGFLSRPWRVLRDALAEAMPPAHRRFFETLPFMEEHGDFAFVHAGIRPGVRLNKQRIADLTMIREPFLSHEGPLGHVVVHGHTITAAPVVRHNRVGLDTGAYRSGVLTCLVLEGDAKGFLLPGGYRPLDLGEID